MIGEKIYITNVKSVSLGKVTFGYDVCANIVGKETLNFLGLPSFKDVM